MNLWEAYYNLGLELFEEEYYEQALEYFVQAYEHGYEREIILKNLYNCFVLPNQQEFKSNYEQSKNGITQLSFEECVLDFIPINEKKFYVFDKERLEFAGIFELEETPVQGEEEEFGSILYADTWDIRDMLPKMREKNWSEIYLVLNEQEKRFVSFLKLPKFRELYLANMGVIQNIDIMRAVFEQCNDFYLPRQIVAVKAEKYLELVKEIHEKRICDVEQERDHIFLSICIPSYNRGMIALNNVRYLLQCVYDSEIEIIVSNNGSTEDVEGYKEIQSIRDSRLRYHEFEENKGFTTNVLKTLEMAKGKYAVLVSDEDLMILEHMGEYLNHLKANPQCGVFWESGIGGNFPEYQEDAFYKAGKQAMLGVSYLNYMTGTTYHMDLLRAVNAFDIMKSMRGNIFLENYGHIPLAIIAGKYADFYQMQLPLWEAESNAKEEEEEFRILDYQLPDNRIEQQNAIMDFYKRGVNLDGNTFLYFFINRCEKTYSLLTLVYQYEKFKKIYTWEEICIFIHKKNIEYVEKFPVGLREIGRKKLKEVLFETFSKYLNLENILMQYSPEERRKKKLLNDIIEMEMAEGKEITDITDLTEDYEENIKQYLIQEQQKQREIREARRG